MQILEFTFLLLLLLRLTFYSESVLHPLIHSIIPFYSLFCSYSNHLIFFFIHSKL